MHKPVKNAHRALALESLTHTNERNLLFNLLKHLKPKLFEIAQVFLLYSSFYFQEQPTELSIDPVSKNQRMQGFGAPY